MKNRNTQIFAHRTDPFGTIGLWVKSHNDVGLGTKPYIAEPLTFRVLTEADEGFIQRPVLEMNNDEAQQLMDTLWQVGIRPTEGTGSAGSLAATQRHLEDMRALVFQQPKPKSP